MRIKFFFGTQQLKTGWVLSSLILVSSCQISCSSGPEMVNKSSQQLPIVLGASTRPEQISKEVQFVGNVNRTAIKGLVFKSDGTLPVPVGRVNLKIESEKKQIEAFIVQTEPDGVFEITRDLPMDVYRLFVNHKNFYGQIRLDLTREPDLEVKLEVFELDELSSKVMRSEGTEPAFKNKYWDLKKEGLFVEKISGEVLFSSKHKYDSGTGWPSFHTALVPDNILLKEDRSWWSVRTEVRSRGGDHHLGHVFDDGPPPTGKRYCMNSASLRFIPREDLVRLGYGEWLSHFSKD